MINLKKNFIIDLILLTALVCLTGFNSDILAQVIVSTDSTPPSNARTPSTIVTINGHQRRAVEDNTSRPNKWEAGMAIPDNGTSAGTVERTCNIEQGTPYNKPCYYNTKSQTCTAIESTDTFLDNDSICDPQDCTKQLLKVCEVKINLSAMPVGAASVNCDGCLAVSSNARQNSVYLVKEKIKISRGDNVDSDIDYGKGTSGALINISLNDNDYICEDPPFSIDCGESEYNPRCHSNVYEPACLGNSHKYKLPNGNIVCVLNPTYMRKPTVNNTPVPPNFSNNTGSGNNATGSGNGNNNNLNNSNPTTIVTFPLPITVNTPHLPMPAS